MNPIKIKKILEEYSYIIPRYQRNYSWGKKEIVQLIKDICEYFKSDNKEAYYLGSLVCFEREGGIFELIDGQQRHTTITLINLVLKNWRSRKIEGIVEKNNLKYDSRKKAQDYVEKLYITDQSDFDNQVKNLNVLGTGNFKDAIEFIQEELESKKDEEVVKFAKDFYNKVFLFRVKVPEDTDLNHYFEIMNNRGEQLEKHEILKASLMDKIEDRQYYEKFAIIWDACSDMNDYVYFKFHNEDARKKLFDDNGNLKINNFTEITYILSNIPEEKSEKLEDIIKCESYSDASISEEQTCDKYRSIIDFSNFLLQVLKLEYPDVKLDDKKLLEQFNENPPNPESFIIDLLRCRTIFDKYIIKQDLSNADENKQHWGIRTLNNISDDLIKTFETDEHLTKIQLVLYYPDTTNTHNNWLHKILQILKSQKHDILCYDYLNAVRKIAEERFKESLKVEKALLYPSVKIHVFYFIEYLLWRLYKEENDLPQNLYELKKKINNKKKAFNDFKFKYIYSREHLLSQASGALNKIDENILNGIGNLCLISTSQNSEGNKESPADKKTRFKNDISSLKRIIMFESFDNIWNEENIQNHEKEIRALLTHYVS